MTQAPSPASEPSQLPTIIIDPSLYEPDAPVPKQTGGTGFGRLARVTLLTGAVGGATVGFAQLLASDSFTHDFGVASLTKLMSFEERDTLSQGRFVEEPAARVASPAKRVEPAKLSVEAVVSAAPVSQVAAVLEHPPIAALAEHEAKPAAAAEPRELTPSQLDSVVAPALAKPKLLLRANATPSASTPRLDLEASIRNARRLQALNQLEEAEAAYLTVLAQSAEQSAALIGLARIKLAHGQLDAALDFARRAALRAPDQPSVHLTLGDILRARGDQQGAEAEFALAK